MLGVFTLVRRGPCTVARDMSILVTSWNIYNDRQVHMYLGLDIRALSGYGSQTPSFAHVHRMQNSCCGAPAAELRPLRAPSWC